MCFKRDSPFALSGSHSHTTSQCSCFQYINRPQLQVLAICLKESLLKFTLFGRYSFNRLPFSIASAMEHFHKQIIVLTHCTVLLTSHSHYANTLVPSVVYCTCGQTMLETNTWRDHAADKQSHVIPAESTIAPSENTFNNCKQSV